MTQPPAVPVPPSGGELEPYPARPVRPVRPHAAPTYVPTDEVYPASTYSGRGYPGQLYPPQPPADAPWPLVAGEPPRTRRRLLVPALVVGLVLVLGAGLTTLLLVRGGDGSATPAAAVEGFLTGVFTSHSAKDAAAYVCPRSRNQQELEQVVFTVKTFEKEYDSPRTTWSYPQIRPSGRRAASLVTLRLTTANEQVAQKQITLLLVDDGGWWVCDVQDG